MTYIRYMPSLLSTGHLRVSGGVIGLGPDGIVHEGWDGDITETFSAELMGASGVALTAAEKCEIADAMIARWQAWKPHGLTVVACVFTGTQSDGFLGAKEPEQP